MKRSFTVWVSVAIVGITLMACDHFIPFPGDPVDPGHPDTTDVGNPWDTTDHGPRDPWDTTNHGPRDPWDTTGHGPRDPRDTTHHGPRGPRDTTDHHGPRGPHGPRDTTDHHGPRDTTNTI